MKDLIERLTDDIIEAEETQELDPYTLAARYHHHYVMIHAFGDGNGRMARMILNVLLLKYAGHLSLFGSDDQEKDDYLDVLRRGSKVFREEDMEVEFQKQTSHLETAGFILQKSQTSLENMWNWENPSKVYKKS
jgi:Fic family protein